MFELKIKQILTEPKNKVKIDDKCTKLKYF